MPKATKQSKTKQLAYAIKDAEYRWQFLRRSDLYRGAYEEWVSKYPNWHGVDTSWLVSESQNRGEDVRNPSRNSFATKFAKNLQDFRETWKIDPTNPESKVSPFLRERRIWVTPERPSNPGLDKPNFLTVHLNLHGPLVEMMNNLEWLIRHEKRQMGLNGGKNTRKNFVNLENYLQAFDLNRRGNPPKKIAPKLQLGSCSDPPKKVSEWISKAKRLIIRAEQGRW